MYQNNITLCGASAYEKKFYFNQDFNALPDHVKKELQIMCVLYTEDVGGILTLEFDENGRLQFKTEALEADARYDEIGSGLKIKQIQQEKKELLEYIKTQNKLVYRKLRHSLFGRVMNLPGKGGRKMSVAAYKISQKFYGFN